MISPSRSVEAQGLLAALRAEEPASEGPCNGVRENWPTRQQATESARCESCPAVRVLVAVDASEPAKWAVRVGERLAKAVGGEVVLLHVINPLSAIPPEMAVTWEIERIRGALRQTADDLLAAARVRVSPSLHVQQLVREGEAGDEIVAAAREWDATLVVMGTRGRGRLASFLLGSTADEVVRRAHCPVVTVGHDPDARPPEEHRPAEDRGTGVHVPVGV